jgi:hypothetical protein
MTGEWKDKPINFKKKTRKDIIATRKKKERTRNSKKKVVESFGE